MSAVIPFFQPLSRLLSRLWKKANRVAAAEDLAAPLASSDLEELPASTKTSQATVEAASKPAVTAAEAEPVVISFEAPNQRAARIQAQTKELENTPIVTATKTGPETKPKLSHQIEKAVADYVLALKLNHCSPATIRNYKSDIKQFCDFGSEKELSKIFTKPKLLEFAQAETDRGLQSSTVKRKLISIAQFAVWARKGKLITDQRLIESLDRAETPDLIQFSTPAPVEKPETTHLQAAAAERTAPASTQPEIKKPDFSGPSLNKAAVRFSLPALPETVVTKWLPYFNLAVLSVFVIGLGIFTLRQFQNASPSLAYPTTLTRPNRMLSFQGRITNTADTPIVGATSMRFRLFDDVAAGTQLWDSNVCSIDPDQDGIFNTNLGAGAGAGADTENCGAEIAETVFSENPNVWLQVTIGAETLTPRQPIRTVAYALNSETLQGFPAATTATENTVLVMNNSGEVVLGSTAPAIRSTGTSFTLEGNAVTLKTTAASGTDLTLTGDKDVILSTAGTGVVIAQDYLAAPGATLSATYAGGRALTLQAGPSAATDIMQWLTSGGTVLGRISSAGQIGIGNITPEQDLNVVSNLQLGVTDGTRYIYFDNGTGNNAGIRYDSATDKMQFSNDGTTWNDMDSGAGGVTSVSNSDGSLTISPTTGAVVASLNLGNANTWTGLQTFNNTNTDFAQYLRHAGDTDTFLNFTTDRLDANIGGKNVLRLDTNAVQDLIVLGDGTDIDTQILADSGATGLFVEGSTGRVGVGTNAPGAYQLDVAGSTNLSSGNAYYINGSSVLNATTLGTGVTGSSLTSVGALASGSIASGFGTITTANTITGTTLNGTTGINTGASAGTQRIDSSGNLVNIGTTQFNSQTYAWPASAGSNDFVLTTNGAGTLNWSDPASLLAASSYWIQQNGALNAKNNTVDLLVGGSASSSAKFAVLNINSGTPTASVSAGTNGGSYLTATGNLATTANQNLTLGGSTTGNIALLPLNGSGGVTITGSLNTSSTGSFGNTLTVTSGGLGVTGNSTITGTLGSLTGLASSGNIDFSSLSAGGVIKAAGGTGRLSIATGGTDYENPLTFGNGLTRSVNAVSLGGSLTSTTGINQGSHHLTFSGTGLFGIGTSGTPTGKLQVVGTGDLDQLVVTGYSSQTNNLAEFQNSSGTPLAYITGSGGINGASLAIGGTNTIDASRNLLNIGTTQFNSVTYTWPGADGSSSYILSTNGTGTLSWADPSTITAGTNYWNSGSGTIFPKNSTLDFLVGGQASTSAKFAVLNMNSGTPTASVSGTTTNVATYLTGEGNLATTNMAPLTLGGSTTGPIQLSPKGTTGLFVADNGEVGVGTTNPSTLLHVSQTAQASTAEEISRFSISDDATAYAAFVNSSATNSLFSPQLRFRGSGTTTAGHIQAIANSDSGSAPALLITSQMTSSALSTRPVLGIKNYNTDLVTLLANGNLGIGDISPTSLFTVGNGDDFQIDSTGRIINIDSVAHTIDDVAGDLSLTSNSSTISLNDNVAFAGTTTLNSQTYTWPSGAGSNNYMLSTNGSGTLSWSDANTIVGVNIHWNSAFGTIFPKNSTLDFLVGGQASTSAKFAVLNMNSGTPTASVSGTTTNVATYLTGEGNLATTNMAPLTLGGSTTGPIQLSPKGTTGLFVADNGEVGVGTTAPGAELDVNGTIHARTGGVGADSFWGYTNGGTLSFGASNVDLLTASNDYLSLSTNPSGVATERLRIASDGKVGIGTTAAATKLAISDDAGGILALQESHASSAVDIKGYRSRGDLTTPTQVQADDDLISLSGFGYTNGSAFSASARAQIAFNASENYTATAQGSYISFLTTATGGTTLTEQMRIHNDGFVGIGTTNTPALKLDVTGNSSSMTNLLALSNDSSTANSGTGLVIRGKNASSSWVNYAGLSSIITDNTATSEDSRVTIKEMVAGTLTDVLTIDSGSLGINTTPGASNKLDVYSGGTQLFYVNTSKYAYAKRWYDIDNTSYYVEPGASGTSITIAGDISMATGKSITGSGLTFGSAGTTTIGGASVNTSGNLTINGGAGDLTANKIDVTTIDPPYWIEGQKYATYVAGIVGVKEEVTGTIQLASTTHQDLYTYTVDFDHLTPQTDLWLFSRVIDLDAEMKNLTVLLSSDSNARVFYKKDLAKRQLIFFGAKPAEVSFRLTAPRFDHLSHSLVRTDSNPHGLRPDSYVLNNVPDSANTVTETDLLNVLDGALEYNLDQLGDMIIASNTEVGGALTATVTDSENNLITQIGIWSTGVIGQLRAGIVRTQHLEADSIAAPLAVISQLTTQNLQTASVSAGLVQTTVLAAQNASVSGQTRLGSLLAETALINNLTTNDLTTQTASISSGRIAFLESKLAEVTEARFTSISALTATISGTLYAENIADFDQKVANTFRQPSLLASLFAGSASTPPEVVIPNTQTVAPSASSLKHSLTDLSPTADEIVISPAVVIVEKYFEVHGDSYLSGSVGVAGALVISDGLSLAANEIAYNPVNGAPSVFKIQPSGSGRLELMAGRLTFTEAGAIEINSDARVAGAFTVDGKTVLGDELVVKKKANFETGLVIGTDDQAVATISATGRISTTDSITTTSDITAAGTGQFDRLKLASDNLINSGNAPSTSKSTGKAKLAAGEAALTIKSEQISNDTLIYVTPHGSTNNQVLFVKSQIGENSSTSEKEGEFTIGFDLPSSQAVEFTWWLVN